MKRYDTVPLIKSTTGKTYKQTVLYPEIPPTSEDFYIITTAGDRYDRLAQQFYQDSTLWWIIASANNTERASLIVQPGVQLRIPADKDAAVNNFLNLNR
jgi:hypothetical protein